MKCITPNFQLQGIERSSFRCFKMFHSQEQARSLDFLRCLASVFWNVLEWGDFAMWPRLRVASCAWFIYTRSSWKWHCEINRFHQENPRKNNAGMGRKEHLDLDELSYLQKAVELKELLLHFDHSQWKMPSRTCPGDFQWSLSGSQAVEWWLGGDWFARQGWPERWLFWASPHLSLGACSTKFKDI